MQPLLSSSSSFFSSVTLNISGTSFSAIFGVASTAAVFSNTELTLCPVLADVSMYLHMMR